MLNGHRSLHPVDDHGNLDGGISYGNGWTIAWERNQHSRKHGPAGKKIPYGAYVQDIILAVLDRVKQINLTPSASPRTRKAQDNLEQALDAMDPRQEFHSET
jgi:xanthine dehydrogenase molybdopterin-binding subunit B